MDVQFEDIHFVSGYNLLPWKRGPKKVILQGVSGRFKSGELSAILGPSGAGKTSLLNAISGYKTGGVRGRLKINGQKRNEGRFRKVCCYITQEDLLIPSLTLQELMLFASFLKLPSDFSRKQRITVIEEIQSTIGLSEARNTFTEKLSTGQRKRLSIALELINNPPVIFLDEPTSGLDISTATLLIKLLNSLAKGGRTIICTIHQPSASLFSQFDLAYFISKGKCIYNGGTGKNLVSFLSEQRLACPESYNPADYIIELIEDDNNTDILSEGIQNGKITWYNKETDNDVTQAAISKNISFHEYGRNEDRVAPSCLSKKITFWMQFSTLLSRMVLQQKRSVIGLKIQVYYYCICSLFISSMYYKKCNDANEFFNQLKFCVGVVVFHTYTHCMAPILTFPFEIKQLKKEHFNQWYGLLPFYLANSVSKIPLIFVMNQLFLTVAYCLSGLPLELHRFVVFSSFGILVAFISDSLGQTIGSIFSITNGSIIGPMAMAPLLGFAAYGIDFARSISPILYPILRTSYMRSAVNGLILTIFGMHRHLLNCPENEYCHFKDPKVALHYLYLDQTYIWEYALDLVITLCILRVIVYVCLKWRLRR